MSAQIVLFDFDETLIQSKPTYYAAYCHAVSDHINKAEAELIFQNLWNLIVSPKEVFSHLGAERARAILEAFDHYYHSNNNALSPYPAIIDLLERLRTDGVKLGIVSLKSRRTGEKELDICGLRGYFDVVIWGDDVPKPKPAPDGCLRALAELQGDKTRALICGDSTADIKMGHAAGIRTAAALWGSGNRELLLTTSPHYLCEHPHDLLAALN